jgi:transposase-like protein
MPRTPRARTDYLYAGRPGWPASRLTTEQRAEITQRLADGEKTADLAAEYGVTASTIRRYR